MINFYILCAEDDEDDKILFEDALFEILPQRNYDLKFAGNGHECLQLLASLRELSILFLDLNMPVKDGLSCLKEIRANCNYDSLPVVVLSTSKNDVDIVAAFECGADIYAVKPMSFNELCRILKTCLERAPFHRSNSIPPIEDYRNRSFVIK